jgi:glycine/D-amino acid oxidase-like deaminating enzyme/nitrite reductase/ring-hydroxylating ferredoxin subunit
MERRESFWIATGEGSAFPVLDRQVRVEVAVVGAGIVGATAACLLKEAGRSVVLIESDAVGLGVTGNSTAKVTSLHTLAYARLQEQHGDDLARAYADANELALAEIRRRCADPATACGWADATAYTFVEGEAGRADVEREVAAAQRFGLPAQLVEDVPLPFAAVAAVAFSDQGRIDPLRYVRSLVSGIVGGGSAVFERSRVRAVERANGEFVLRTDLGEVRANDVIIATGIPFLDRGLFFARVKPNRSYALALEAPSDGPPPGLFISATTPTHSVRPAEFAGREIVIVSGEGHPVGESDDHLAHARRLESWAHDVLGAGKTLHSWSTQDYFSLDGLPFVGPMQHNSRIYTATGFGGWGITNGTAAATLLADMLLERDNPSAELYKPQRLAVRKLPAFVKKGAHDASHLLADRLAGGSDISLSDLAPGQGKLIELDGTTIAASRDDEGKLYVVSAACTHLGCFVRFNDAEQSWDCPCHGSRFTPEGAVLQGPAIDPLKDESSRLSAPTTGETR